MVTTTLDDVATASPICVVPSNRTTVAPAVTPVTMNWSSLAELELLSDVIWSLSLDPVSEAAKRLRLTGAAGSTTIGTACVSIEESTELATPKVCE